MPHTHRARWLLTYQKLALLLLAAFIPVAGYSQTTLNPSNFTVGNRLISRVFTVENGQASTTALKALREYKVTADEFEIVLRADGRIVLLNRHDCSPGRWSGAPAGLQADLSWASDEFALDIREIYTADESRPYIFKWLEVTNRGSRPVLIERVAVDSLEVKEGGTPVRGGVGQPIFLNNELFGGIEHPAAENRVRGQGVVLGHNPYAEVQPGATWKSKRAVLGAVTAGDGSVEDAFRRYLVEVTGRGPVLRPIYCDWAAHDELGTLLKPQLTEQLTNSLLDQLQSLKSGYGIQFDYYLMDAFWYDPKGAYLTFKKPNWPNGYDHALRRMLDLGMKPGLWFDLGGSTLELRDTASWHGPEKPCLSDAAFAQVFENAFAQHIREHSLGMLKFDFTELLCRRGSDEGPAVAILEKNADSLLEICRKARALNPAMVIRAYNGFSSDEMMESTKYYDRAYAISPWWVIWFDSVYSGDPRPSELPSVTSLRDSVNWYQDHAFRGYARSLMPLFTIDDSGTLIGKTSTILYLGAEGFTDSWILDIMRGDLAPIFYGDLALLTDNDRKFMAGTLRFLREHQDVLANTRPILGIPGRGEVYGYLSDNEKSGFVTLMNPGLFPQSFTLLIPNEKLSRGFTKLVFSNDGQVREPIRRLEGVLQGTLTPGEIRVYALGLRERIEPLELPSAPTRQYHEVTPIGNPFDSNREAEIQLASDHGGMTLAVVIQYSKAGEADRSFERPQEVLRVVGNIGSKQVSFASIPKEGTDIWSHCSWAVFKHQVTSNDANQLLKVKLVGETPPGTTPMITTLWLK
jgi:hypothetical protein